MKKISKEQLKIKLREGWAIDEIAEPAMGKELLMLSKTINNNTKKAISDVQSIVNEFIASQEARDAEIMSLGAKTTPKKWQFHVERDHRGLIERVIATEI